MIQYDESPAIDLSFYPDKTATTTYNVGIPSIHFDQIKKLNQILFKVGKDEDIPKYFEPNPKTISQSMENIILFSGFTETGKSARDKLNNHTYWE